MSEMGDMDKEHFEDIELERTLDAAIADDITISATIKAPLRQSSDNFTTLTQVTNPDQSQTITIKKDSFSYQQQTIIDPAQSSLDADATVAFGNMAEIDSAKTLPQGDAAETIQNTEAVGDKGATLSADDCKTIVDMSEHEAPTVAAPVASASAMEETLVAGTAAEGATVKNGASSSSSVPFTSTSGSAISFSGGSISVNVRHRNVASSVGAKVVGGKGGVAFSGDEFSDFELIEKLGEGGMGVVYSARQSSIDRAIALKMIKSDIASEEARSKFLVEAVVTGDLDHPNIVPVHDLGVDSAGNIFYAMKQVTGSEWSKVIKQKSRMENIEILLRVCDAIAFAHSRGVIHRDLKPENVMLGSFGEVLVMDWGLALAVNDTAKAEAINPNLGIAGTPAYLAPEMARVGLWRLLGFCSDIYLLGAILFEIITGKRPHRGKTVRECLKNAAKNIIVEVDAAGELLEIAYKAMSTDPCDRYQSVQDFQHAIREYLSHSESVTLADKAESDLKQAEASGDYDDYAKALFGFRQAVELWPENSAACNGQIRAGVAYAFAALGRGDLDLGLSLVTQEDEFSEVREKLLQAKHEREKHQRRLKLLTRGVAVLGVVIVCISVIAAVWIQTERSEAIAQREEALRQEKIAKEQREEALHQEKIAQQQREEAQKQEKIAQQQREEAQKQEKIAVVQREEARKQTVIAEQQREEARKQTVIAEQQREEAKRQEQIATEKKLLAEAETKRANEQSTIAQQQREIALKQKEVAEQQTVRANEQTEIAEKARVTAEEQREKARKSEARALEAVDKMVRAQTAQQLEKARREAAELTAKETKEELAERDELKEDNWWTFGSEEAVKRQQEAAAKYNLPVEKKLTVGEVELSFRLIPPGIFGMGSRVDEPGRSSEEYLHRVEISRPFYIEETELTQEAWNKLTGVSESAEGGYPAWNISYEDISRDLLPVINAKLPAGWEVRLPSEAQWEWAARAGTNTPYYSGTTSADLKRIGYTGVELLTSAKAVAKLEPNAWGLYDVLGNVAEWCSDTYVRDGYLSKEKVQTDPLNENAGKYYVVRGGAWSNLPEHCRVAYRSYAGAKSRYNFLGVRLVLIPPAE